jgi:hypothetical protein
MDLLALSLLVDSWWDLLMQGLRGFSSQAAKPAVKQIKVLLFSVDLVRMYQLCGMIGYCYFDDIQW